MLYTLYFRSKKEGKTPERSVCIQRAEWFNARFHWKIKTRWQFTSASPNWIYQAHIMPASMSYTNAVFICDYMSFHDHTFCIYVCVQTIPLRWHFGITSAANSNVIGFAKRLPFLLSYSTHIGFHWNTQTMRSSKKKELHKRNQSVVSFTNCRSPQFDTMLRCNDWKWQKKTSRPQYRRTWKSEFWIWSNDSGKMNFAPNN